MNSGGGGSDGGFRRLAVGAALGLAGVAPSGGSMPARLIPFRFSRVGLVAGRLFASGLVPISGRQPGERGLVGIPGGIQQRFRLRRSAFGADRCFVIHSSVTSVGFRAGAIPPARLILLTSLPSGTSTGRGTTPAGLQRFRQRFRRSRRLPGGGRRVPRRGRPSCPTPGRKSSTRPELPRRCRSLPRQGADWE